jgi:hypothetical protein
MNTYLIQWNNGSTEELRGCSLAHALVSNYSMEAINLIKRWMLI